MYSTVLQFAFLYRSAKNFGPGVAHLLYRVRQNYPDFFIFTSFIFIIFFYSDKMKSLKNLRDAIIHAHERGKKQVEIAEFLGISTSTVNDAIKRYKETGNNEDRKGRGRKKTARTRKNVLCAKGMIKRNHTTRANSTRNWLRSWMCLKQAQDES